MRIYELIKKKRDGEELTGDEIRAIVNGYVYGEIPDYQISALLMAIYFRGMTVDETTALTLAIRDSGERLDFSSIDGIRVDKHSTGGVGDKTSLVITPIVASLGLKVAKMSGRGLGHTGGTVDKLEAIPGFRTDMPLADFTDAVNRVGAAIIGQTKSLAPADKLIYALRDVTATVDSIPLIVSSIMGKKLAADDDIILLDVKCGSGAFAKTVDESRELATQMVEIGKRAGKRMRALITDMDTPLGRAIGNSLEVAEAVEVLRGEGPEDLRQICLAICAHILSMSGKGEYGECIKLAEDAIASGAALEKLCEMVAAQGGNSEAITDTSLLPSAAYSEQVLCTRGGYVSAVNAEGYGEASLLLGAGRITKEDSIDYSAGIRILKSVGDRIGEGEAIAALYSNDPSRFDIARKRVLSSTVISDTPPKKQPLIIDVIT